MARPGRSSSRKTHLKYSKVSPHSPRSIQTTPEIKSELELIQGNGLSVKPLLNERHRDTSVPVLKLVQRSQRERMGNIPRPLVGDHELLLTHQELSASGEDHKALKRIYSIFFQIKGQKDKELAEKSKSFIHTPKEGTRNEPIFGEISSSSVNQLQKSQNTISINLRKKRSQEHLRQG
ncbi:hypothetical protein O181_129706 [Austropuccinia psidii MF-1]|uniref:Uncharacterized protein n=1 Tax=Austropuccinia psidii MF-1 TaxID=1389203 RepID=A0A9Q3L1C2_9BASI|nr:hypothetical protein [Austropuccinia psidii MF-1]